MHKESPIRVLAIAALVCAVCSIFVSAAAVGLRPQQQANKLRDTQRYILQTAGLYEPGSEGDLAALFQQIEGRVIDLETGEFVEGVTPDDLEKQGAKNEAMKIAAESDIAGLGEKPARRAIYFVREGNRLERLILPVEGKGLWSTMHGFVALGPDLATIKTFCIYDHAETPGLGGEVSSPKWLALWDEKTAIDAEGRPILEVVKGAVDPRSPNADHQIDGLSGATLTGRGVTNLVHFWLGEQGYGPLLDRLREGGDHVEGI
ncbi:MAG: Na(+)-translocating NADH-quinone reductase subunit C [Planctomycetaceae bacterium]|nr:Na(+)-translocating NADH-quinone reductase subunit C [Planctomycetaceae bacterium]